MQSLLERWDQDEHPDLHGVVVRVNGAVVAERHYHGADPQALHDIRSAGKSITSLLVGAARDRGLLGALDEQLERYWPRARGSALGRASLAALLTMRSGLAANDQEPDSPGNEDRMDAASDPVAFLLGIPAVDRPGTRYVYNSLTAYAVGLLLEHTMGKSLLAFAREALFEPLGIQRVDWASDAAGHTKGQGNLSLTTGDLARIGQALLDGGQWQGRRILSSSWIKTSMQALVPIGPVDPYADSYGYFWYTKTHQLKRGTETVRFASGNGGNKLYLVPSRRMVVAITSRAYGHGYGQRRSEAILKALLSA
ncbi:beta-lactamase family protein [Archangium violaceum]|uniref:serine hydrolase domain-containing protein n=1 Tax=Archangium violaceum TaxID=83451 RepID=UPI00194EABEE|nr:serine hydrolase domain-containing protein [Archangium violaceum]QRN94908.1 beta-lactamase family protein [Archangium violaceum]